MYNKKFILFGVFFSVTKKQILDVPKVRNASVMNIKSNMEEGMSNIVSNK